jgi:hypothetical protein
VLKERKLADTETELAGAREREALNEERAIEVEAKPTETAAALATTSTQLAEMQETRDRLQAELGESKEARDGLQRELEPNPNQLRSNFPDSRMMHCPKPGDSRTTG